MSRTCRNLNRKTLSGENFQYETRQAQVLLTQLVKGFLPMRLVANLPPPIIAHDQFETDLE